MKEPIKFKANIQAIRTCIDGGYRITLDLSEAELTAAMSLMGLRGAVLDVSFVPEETD